MYIIDLVIRTPVQLCAFQQSEQLKATKTMLKPTSLKKIWLYPNLRLNLNSGSHQKVHI